MPSFEYLARDAADRQVTGRLDAADEAAASAVLAARNLRVIELLLIADSPAHDSPARSADRVLTASEVEQFTAPIAQLSAGGLPLAPGLRAAARESSSDRVARALDQIAAELENGRPLDEVMNHDLLPPHVSRLVASAAKSGNLGAALTEIVEHQAVLRELRSTLVQGFAYPLLVTGLAACVLVTGIYLLVPTFSKIYTDFELEMPLSTQLLIWWRDVGLPLLLGAAIAGWIGSRFVRRLIRAAAWDRLRSEVPLVGVLSFWSAMAEWSSLINVLLRHQIPLPDALRLSGQGIANADLAQMAEVFSRNVEKGHSLSDALAANGRFPATAAALIRWGEQNGMLSESFAMAKQMFLRRLRGRTLLLRTIGIPLLFVGIVCGFKFVLGGLLVPLVSLIQGLA